jgi:hypothetical protein
MTPKSCCAEMIARIDPIADASLPAMRERSSPGVAIAATTPMIPTTTISSSNVNPRDDAIDGIRLTANLEIYE